MSESGGQRAPLIFLALLLITSAAHAQISNASSSLDMMASSHLQFNCSCGDKCLLSVPSEPISPDYSALNAFLTDRGLQADQAKLINAVGGNISEGNNATVIKFGFLYEMLIPFIIGAVEVAVGDINRDPSILPNVRLEYEFRRIHSEN